MDLDLTPVDKHLQRVIVLHLVHVMMEGKALKVKKKRKETQIAILKILGNFQLLLSSFLFRLSHWGTRTGAL